MDLESNGIELNSQTANGGLSNNVKYENVVVSPLQDIPRLTNIQLEEIYSDPASSPSSKDFVDDVKIPEISLVPNIWSKDFVGIYCSYAIFGLILGGSGTWLPFCEYVYKGSSNLCANTGNIGFFAWNFKVFVAVVTDMYAPFGYRRKSWMLMGLFVTLFLTFMLAVVPPDSMGANVWISLQFFIQMGVMFSDVPSDGYCVELGQMESLEQRGQILVVGQKVQYVFCIFAGLIQAFLLNGRSTSAKDCDININHCWEWGLSVQQYNALMFVIIFVLAIPVLFLKEVDNPNIPHRSGVQFLNDLWNTMQNLPTFYLSVYVLGISALTYTYSNVNLYIQYYIIKLSNFQVGIDTMATYVGLWGATYMFQVWLIKLNWRYTQYFSTYFGCVMSLLWIPVFYNSGGLRDPWFTIFIDFDANFALGLTEILFAVAVIEVAKAGQEASTYEYLSTVLNNGWSFALMLSSQMLIPLKAGGCTDDQQDCDSSAVNISDVSKYNATNGPWKFTAYTLVLNAINLIGVWLFTRFLPGSVKECHELKAKGERVGDSKMRGYASLIILIVSFVVSTSCFT